MVTTLTRHRFNRAMALAVAAGVALTGGVQIAQDNNTAAAKTYNASDGVFVARFDSPSEPNLVAVHPPERNDKGYLMGQVTVLELDSNVKGLIGRAALEKAGLDFSKPITFDTLDNDTLYAHLSTGEVTTMVNKGEYDLSNLDYIEMPGGDRGLTLRQTIDGKIRSALLIRYDSYVGFPRAVQSRNLVPNMPVHFQANDETPATVTIFSPQLMGLPLFELIPFKRGAGVTFKSDNPNVIVEPDGGFTYTPPAEAAGTDVSFKITAVWDGLEDGYVLYNLNTPASTKPTAAMVYNVAVQKLPEREANTTPVTFKDNGDGTFTFNSGEEGAEDITINTKDGVQNVTKQGNTLIFTMADGSTKKVDVAANVTLKQNTNGTATISDGTTTLTVATANTYIDKVEKNAKGDYVLTRNDGETLTINLQDLRNDIKTLKDKNSPSRAEHNEVEGKIDKLKKQLNEFTKQSNGSLKEIAEQISALDGKIDTNAKELRDELTGISTDVQDLESRVERTENRLIKEVRDNHDGTFTLVTEKNGDIPGVIDASSGVTNIISNPDGTLTLEFAGKQPRTVDLHTVEVTETGKGTPKHTITITVPGEEPFRFNAFDTYVSRIDTDGKGTYTLKLNNGETVNGVINTSKTIKSIENRPDGSIVLVRTDGTKSDPIKLEQVKVTEAGKGTPQHTVTIAVPGGETITLDAYDNFVTSVTKTSDGVYTIARNDGQTWTINIADLYKRVANLEAKDSPSRDEFNAVKNDIAAYKTLVDTRFTAVEGDVDALRTDLTTLENRTTVLEARVNRIDSVLGDLAKCNSAGQVASIPAVLSVALFALSQAHLPGVEAMNTQIQKQIGIYNANAAAMWSQYGGVLQSAAAATVFAGMIGTLAYALHGCQDYNRTDEMKNTPAGKLTAHTDARKAEREARAHTR